MDRPIRQGFHRFYLDSHIHSRNAAIESETISSPGFDPENKMSARKKRKISVASDIMDDMPDVPREGVNHKDEERAI